MGALTQAMARACAEQGVEIRTGADVSSIVVENGTARGVVLASGERIDTRMVVSTADCHVTFLKLVGESHLPREFVAGGAPHRLLEREHEDQPRRQRAARFLVHAR
jgi:phytoene dehydrogenase-like protein